MPENNDKELTPVPTLPTIIIGAGPAGLMAAETIATAGHKVIIYDRKPSPARKFLMAGRGGLNLTHSEPLDKFLTRYGAAEKILTPILRDFPPEKLIAWCEGLGQPTFTGSSGRIFPKSMKASPLLRAWLARLETLKVEFRLRHTWTGWDENNNLTFTTPEGTTTVKPAATILALGGASWPDLGSDGAWTKILAAKNILLSPLEPSNCGFTVNWSTIFRDKFSGTPLKSIAISFDNHTIPGEIMLTKNGIEGGAIYALSSTLREAISKHGEAIITIDLRPTLSSEQLTQKLGTPRGRQSFSTWIQKTTNLPPAAISLLRETGTNPEKLGPRELTALIKFIPLKLTAPFAIDQAISSAGGIHFEAIDETLMLKALPGTFAAGEMLDWEAPTGGYLLQASFATAQKAALGTLKWLGK